MAFKDIFRDDNTFNEKTIVGFSSFAIMVIFAAADIVTGLFGKSLIISDTIFNSFVIITLGSFGIDGITRIFKKNNGEIN
jgi:predicted Co/Zn/Cd cation transporter (cation efflux family)